MNWEDYVPKGSVKVVTYANSVFWFDNNNEIITQDRDIKTFQQWVEETGETK